MCCCSAAFWCLLISVGAAAWHGMCVCACKSYDWHDVAVWCDAGIPSSGLLLLWCGLHWLPCLWKHDWGSDSVLPGTPNLGCVSCISHGYHPCVRQLPGELRSGLIHSVILLYLKSDLYHISSYHITSKAIGFIGSYVLSICHFHPACAPRMCL